MSEDFRKEFCNYLLCWPLWCFLSLNNDEAAHRAGQGRAGQQACLLYEGEVPCLTCAGADLAVRKKACQRRNLVSSAISVAALTFTTLKTVRPRHRCWRSRPTRRTTAAGERSAPIAIPARCSGTGRPTAMTMRPSNAACGQEDRLSVRPNGTIYATSICVCWMSGKGTAFLDPLAPIPLAHPLQNQLNW